MNAVITGNDIKNCGIHDYEFHTGGKNGEGVYIGTSSNQVIQEQPSSQEQTLLDDERPIVLLRLCRSKRYHRVSLCLGFSLCACMCACMYIYAVQQRVVNTVPLLSLVQRNQLDNITINMPCMLESKRASIHLSIKLTSINDDDDNNDTSPAHHQQSTLTEAHSAPPPLPSPLNQTEKK